MAITPKLEFRQSQSLLMTPQLRQAINLLQLSNLELNEFIEQELEANPLLAKEEDHLESFDTSAQTIDDYDKPEFEDEPNPDSDYDAQFDDYGSDREGYGGENDASWSDYSSSKSKTGSDDFDYFEKRLQDKKSIYTLLEEQIAVNFAAQKEKLIASRLCEFLDEAGYFRGDIAEIAKKIKTSKDKVKAILDKMKQFEPSGIFAQNLKECLIIQLKDKGRYDPLIADLLNNLELLGQKKYKELTKLLNLGEDDLSDMINDIKSLNPKPTAEYNTTPASCVIPDAFVKTNKYDEFMIELNNMSLPKVLINRQYYSEIKQVSEKNKEASRYLKDQLNNANFLLKSLHQRATTLLRVTEEIVKYQRDFFLKGVESLKPMQLKDIAEAVEMHESTVSRVTTGKYISSPLGTFELKYFFSAAAGSYTGDENTSTISIKHKIKRLIDEENKENILSDDKIVEELAKEGVKIARRTVAKYREAMNIPTSADRKREKRNLLAA